MNSYASFLHWRLACAPPEVMASFAMCLMNDINQRKTAGFKIDNRTTAAPADGLMLPRGPAIHTIGRNDSARSPLRRKTPRLTRACCRGDSTDVYHRNPDLLMSERQCESTNFSDTAAAVFLLDLRTSWSLVRMSAALLRDVLNTSPSHGHSPQTIGFFSFTIPSRF